MRGFLVGCFSVFLGCVLLGIFPEAHTAEYPRTDWWDVKWPYRRSIDVRKKSKGYAVARFNTLGRARRDRADLRVIADGKRLVAVAVLDTGCDDTALISFPVRDPEASYRVYFGNFEAAPPPKPYFWRQSLGPGRRRGLPKGGLLYEVRELEPGKAESWADMRSMLGNSKEVLGRGLSGKCALGLNPFGLSRNYLVLWHGYLEVTEGGKWWFATNSNGPSFVLINGRPVASWPGWHSARGGAQAAHRGELWLGRGFHRFEYYYAARNGRNGHVCGVKPPSEDRIRALRVEDLARLVPVSVGPLEEVYSLKAGDFKWKITGDLGLSGRDVTLVRFTDRSKVPGEKIASRRWRFGDGQSGTGRSIGHVYLKGGGYEIEVVVETAEGTKLRNLARISVHPKGRRGAGISRLVSKSLHYDLSKLDRKALENLLYLRWQDRETRGFYEAAWDYFQRKPELSSDELQHYAEELLDRLFLKEPGKTVELAGYILENAEKPALKAKAAQLAGDTLWHVLGSRKEAKKLWQDSLSSSGNWKGTEVNRRLRLLRLSLSDLHAAAGRTEKAGELRRRAAQEAGGGEEHAGGGYVFLIYHYLREKKFAMAWAALNDWLLDEPEILKSRELCFFRGEILYQMGKHKRSLTEIKRFLPFASSAGRKEALARTVSLYDALGLEKKAKETKELLKREFPGGISGEETAR